MTGSCPSRVRYSTLGFPGSASIRTEETEEFRDEMIDLSNLKPVELLYHGKGTGRYKYLDCHGTIAARQCKACLVVKSIDEYSYSTSRGLRKYKTECRPCGSERSLSWNKSNPERFSQNTERYYDRLASRSTEELLADMVKKYPDGVRKCTVCKDWKDFSLFYVDKFKSGGLGTRCLLCSGAYHVAWVEENPQRAAELSRASAERFKSRTEEEILSDQERIHPGGIKTCKACRESKPITDFYRNKIRYDGLTDRCGPCAIIHTSMKRRQRRPKYWESRGIPLECYMCGDDFEEVEHVIPLALEGSDTDENTLPSCSVCNGAKSDIPLEIFVQRYEDPAAILKRVESYGVSWVV